MINVKNQQFATPTCHNKVRIVNGFQNVWEDFLRKPDNHEVSSTDYLQKEKNILEWAKVGLLIRL